MSSDQKKQATVVLVGCGAPKRSMGWVSPSDLMNEAVFRSYHSLPMHYVHLIIHPLVLFSVVTGLLRIVPRGSDDR